MLGDRMGGLNYAGLPYVVELLQPPDVAEFLRAVVQLKLAGAKVD